MSTTFEEVSNRCLQKIERDRDFFEYYNVSVEETQAIIEKQLIGYLKDAIDLFVLRCDTDLEINLYDYDEDNQCFNSDLTNNEVGIIASLMYEVHFARDEARLRSMAMRMSPTDLNRWSPANERASFMAMLDNIRRENELMVAKYCSTDRSTGKRLTINPDDYNYD